MPLRGRPFFWYIDSAMAALQRVSWATPLFGVLIVLCVSCKGHHESVPKPPTTETPLSKARLPAPSAPSFERLSEGRFDAERYRVAGSWSVDRLLTTFGDALQFPALGGSRDAVCTIEHDTANLEINIIRCPVRVWHVLYLVSQHRGDTYLTRLAEQGSVGGQSSITVERVERVEGFLNRIAIYTTRMESRDQVCSGSWRECANANLRSSVGTFSTMTVCDLTDEPRCIESIPMAVRIVDTWSRQRNRTAIRRFTLNVTQRPAGVHLEVDRGRVDPELRKRLGNVDFADQVTPFDVW